MVRFPKIEESDRHVRFDISTPRQPIYTHLPKIKLKWSSSKKIREDPKIQLWEIQKTRTENRVKVKFLSETDYSYADALPKQRESLPKLTDSDLVREKAIKRQLQKSIQETREVLAEKKLEQREARNLKDKKSEGNCPACEAAQLHKFKSPKRIHKHEHKVNAVMCNCDVCQTVVKGQKTLKIIFHEEEQSGRIPNVPPRNLLAQLQINKQMNMLRAMQNLTPIQMYSNRMIRFKLMQNHRRQTLPLRLQPNSPTNDPIEGAMIITSASRPQTGNIITLRNHSKLRNVYGPRCSVTLLGRDEETRPSTSLSRRTSSGSSSTPTVPYSTADVLYGNEVSRSPQLEEGRQNSFIDFTGKEQRTSSRELGDLNPRRPSSKAGSKKSFSIEKVNSARESEDNLRPSVLPNPKTVNQYRPNGVRNSFLKSEPLFSSRSNAISSGRDADDLIAMGTIWSPNAHSSLKQLNNNTSSANSLTNNSIPNVSGKNIQMQTTQGSNSSTGIGQSTRGRYNGTGMRPIMVQPTRNNVIKEVDPKYTDPVIGAPASFQQRLMELSALEAETIRYERNKKVKKKVKQDRDS